MRIELLEYGLWRWEAEQNVRHSISIACSIRFNRFHSRMLDPMKSIDSYVSVEYLTWPIIRYKREVLFGWVDLLVSFGGIAGLFLGFSLLSGVEVIYYFTLRAFCMLYQNRVGQFCVWIHDNCGNNGIYDFIGGIVQNRRRETLETARIHTHDFGLREEDR